MFILNRSLLAFQTWALTRLRRLALRLRFGLTLLASLFACLWWAAPAQAVPAFARQTGQNCIACHVGGFGPQLTPFGRAFKLSGYTLTNGKKHIPLSAMLVSSFTHTTEDQTPFYNGMHGNDNFVALQQASIFLAGRLTDHIGMMGQATYSETAEPANLGWDNTDIRYADNYRLGNTSGIFGVSVNNNPTVSDVWNTVPAWQYGFMTSPISGGVPFAPLMASLGGSVLGTTAYTLIDNHWYIEGGAYHGLANYWGNLLHAGAWGVTGYAPYFRANYSTTIGSSTYEGGILGMNMKPATITGGSGTDNVKDIGIDGTYQYIDGDNRSVTVNGLYMQEKASYDQSAGAYPSDTAKTLNVNAAYWIHNTYGATIQYFNVNGTAALGSNVQSNGVVWELDWNPFGQSWTNPEKNMRLGLQYTTYNKLNGTSQGASGNNSLFLYMWLAI
ncbi:MAG: cytochrome c1 protein [Thiomonas sp.]|nr:cytochrome c1 protein [Thiomonas sp.]